MKTSEQWHHATPLDLKLIAAIQADAREGMANDLEQLKARCDDLQESLNCCAAKLKLSEMAQEGMVNKDELRPTIELLTRLAGHYYEPQIAHYRIVNEIARLKSLQGEKEKKSPVDKSNAKE